MNSFNSYIRWNISFDLRTIFKFAGSLWTSVYTEDTSTGFEWDANFCSKFHFNSKQIEQKQF